MDNYITGQTIKKLRENKKMTQLELAKILNVSDKTISKWETSKGLPDITLLEPLAMALNVSVSELMSGNCISNNNRNANILNSKIYVCPICGNVIYTVGNAMISCCGITLPECLAEEIDDNDTITCEIVENEYYVMVNHPMMKEHYISFIAYVTTDRFEMVKLYAESMAENRFLRRGAGIICVYCNKHGLLKLKV